MTLRRSVLGVASTGAALAVLGLPAGAQTASNYPSRAVRLVVAYSPGGIFDIFARAIAKRLSEVWKQPVVVENKPGASEIIGAQAVATAPPDGYTIFVSSETALQTNPLLYAKLPYDPSRDFAPIIRVAEGTRVLAVRQQSALRSLKDLQDAARAAPGTLSYGTSGIGTPVHILQHWFGLQTRTQYIHVPYKGTAQAVQDLLGGQTDFTWAPLPLVQQFIKEGRLRALAVTGASRMTALPDVPTLSELGHRGMDMNLMISLVAPSRTPADIVAKIARDVRAILRDRQFEQEVTVANAFTTVADTPQEFAASLTEEAASFREKVRSLNVQLN